MSNKKIGDELLGKRVRITHCEERNYNHERAPGRCLCAWEGREVRLRTDRPLLGLKTFGIARRPWSLEHWLLPPRVLRSEVEVLPEQGRLPARLLRAAFRKLFPKALEEPAPQAGD